MNLKTGEKVPLSILIEDRATDKFVRAIVRKADGDTVVGSPFTVPHKANGLHYSNDLITMPGERYIHVEYDVFEDAGFTVPSIYEPDAQFFDIDEIDTINVPSPTDAIGEIMDEYEVTAEVEDIDVIGVVGDDNDLEGTVDDVDVGGQIADLDIIGEVRDCGND